MTNPHNECGLDRNANLREVLQVTRRERLQLDIFKLRCRTSLPKGDAAFVKVRPNRIVWRIKLENLLSTPLIRFNASRSTTQPRWLLSTTVQLTAYYFDSDIEVRQSSIDPSVRLLLSTSPYICAGSWKSNIPAGRLIFQLFDLLV